MAKRRGLLQHAVKAVKQQQKAAAAGAKSGPGSDSGAKPGTKAGSGPPATKKQKTTTKPGNNNNSNNKKAHQQQNQKPTIPFSPTDSILLVGEGDLSFAASLITHHHCTNVTATVLEKDFAELSAKYPHVGANVAVIESPAHPHCRLLYGIDATKLPAFTTKQQQKQQPPPPISQAQDHSPGQHHQHHPTPPAAATTGAMQRIIFNFPHTGGKSTDVNRQVRRNQELLVAFFRRAQASLAPGGSIVVTLFEGEPYTLWNVRDLARHAGLAVQRSFRFAAAAYPGYAHARTLGVVRNRRGEVASRAWRGEDRPARSYVFVRKGEVEEGVVVGAGGSGRKRKRGRLEGSSSSDEESEESGEDDGGEIGAPGSEDDEGEEEEEEEGIGSSGDGEVDESEVEGEDGEEGDKLTNKPQDGSKAMDSAADEHGTDFIPGDGDASSDGD